jgi:hypothetical protein
VNVITLDIPGFDKWKTASPPEGEWATCECGHGEENHDEAEAVDGETGEVLSPCGARLCKCTNYKEREPYEPDFSRDYEHA